MTPYVQPSMSSSPLPDVLAELWDALEFLDRKSERYNNWATFKGLIDLKLTNLAEPLNKYKIQLNFTNELRQAMKESRQPSCMSCDTKHSSINGKPVKRWEFEGLIHPKLGFTRCLRNSESVRLDRPHLDYLRAYTRAIKLLGGTSFRAPVFADQSISKYSFNLYISATLNHDPYDTEKAPHLKIREGHKNETHHKAL